MKALPSYTFLLGEYVGRLEALLTYDKIPPEVKENMRQRAKELKALKLTASDINRLIDELDQVQHFQSPIPGLEDYSDALFKPKD